jgi:hypothetical protein
MTLLRSTAALILVGVTFAIATAQPKPPVIQFKQFGSTPEQFLQSSLTRWTGQLALDLETLKAEVTNAKLTPAQRNVIITQADKAILETAELDQQIRRGAAKDRLNASFADVDRSLTQLAVLINQVPAAKLATAGTMTKLDYAYHQLASVLGTGDNDPGRAKRRLQRLADSIDDNAEELRTLAADLIPGVDRPLDRSLAGYSREARSFSRRVRDDADTDLLKKGYAIMADRWTDTLTQLARVRQLPPAVLAQAARLDGLHRRMGATLDLPPYPPGVNPPVLGPQTKHLSFAVGADAGAQPRVTVFADEKGTVAYNFFAYDVRFDGGVRVDMADLNGDSIPELIVAPGPSKNAGGLPVRVYDGRDLSLLIEFVPFAGWKGGLYAVATDLTKDRRALIAVTAEGSQHIKVFDLVLGKEIDSFFAHDQKVPGGVRIAWGDVNGDGAPDLLTVNGPSNVPTTVKIFNGKNRDVISDFLVLDNKYRGGGFIACSDLTGNGLANPVVGLDEGAVSLVRIYDLKGKTLAEWLPFDDKFRGGVRVAVTNRNNVVVAPGLGLRNSPVRIYHTGRLKAPLAEFSPFPGFDGGLNVGGK